MQNDEIAKVLDEIAEILDLSGETSFVYVHIATRRERSMSSPVQIAELTLEQIDQISA